MISDYESVREERYRKYPGRFVHEPEALLEAYIAWISFPFYRRQKKEPTENGQGIVESTEVFVRGNRDATWDTYCDIRDSKPLGTNAAIRKNPSPESLLQTGTKTLATPGGNKDFLN